jgi:hypothetical protein
MGLVPKELPSSEMGGLGEPRQLRIYSKTRVVSSTSVYVHIPATWRRHVVLCTHVAHETTQQYAYDPVCGYDTGSSRLW